MQHVQNCSDLICSIGRIRPHCNCAGSSGACTGPWHHLSTHWFDPDIVGCGLHSFLKSRSGLLGGYRTVGGRGLTVGIDPGFLASLCHRSRACRSTNTRQQNCGRDCLFCVVVTGAKTARTIRGKADWRRTGRDFYCWWGDALALGYAAEPLLPQLGHVGEAHAHTEDTAHGHAAQDAHANEEPAQQHADATQAHHNQAETQPESHAHADNNHPHSEATDNAVETSHPNASEQTVEQEAQSVKIQPESAMVTDHHSEDQPEHAHQAEAEHIDSDQHHAEVPQVVSAVEDTAIDSPHSHSEGDHTHQPETASNQVSADNTTSAEELTVQLVTSSLSESSRDASGKISDNHDQSDHVHFEPELGSPVESVPSMPAVPSYSHPQHWGTQPHPEHYPDMCHPMMWHPIHGPSIQDCPIAQQQFRDRWRFARLPMPPPIPPQWGWPPPAPY